MRLADICDMSAGNAFLPGFMKQFNEKSSLPAVKTENLRRKLNVRAPSLADILCHREQRQVGQQLSLAYDRRQIILERSELADGLEAQYVAVSDFADRPLEVRWKGDSLPPASSAKTSASAHTAVVKNKRHNHVLTIIKAQQDLKNQTKIKKNGEKIAYKENSRRLYGPDYKPKLAAAPAVEMTARTKTFLSGANKQCSRSLEMSWLSPLCQIAMKAIGLD